jgi:uncharacterized protein DUF3224
VADLDDASGEFTVTGGEEEAYRERDPGKLTRAGGTQEFSGDIEGTGRVEWLMCYLADGTAEYVGMQEIEGAVQGRKGSFVATAAGRFDGKQSEGRWAVVAGSGTGELAGITGTGGFSAGPGPHASYRLSYELG